MASSTEIHRLNDSTPDNQAKDPARGLPYVDRIDVLSGLKLLPPGQQTADVQKFSLDATKVEAFVYKPDRSIVPSAEPAAVADSSITLAKVKLTETSTSESFVAGKQAVNAAARPDAAVRPDAPANVPTDSPLKTLQSADATAQQKIEAVSQLYDTMPKDGKGRVHLTIHDGDKDKQFEISKEKLGHGVNLTHLTYRDENGHVHPVLRGVERSGHIDREHDKHGNKADFKGDWWSKHAGDSAISHFAPSTDAPLPPTPPVREPQRDETRSGEREKPVLPLPPIPDRDHHREERRPQSRDGEPVRPHPAPRHGPSNEFEPAPAEKPKHERDQAPERRPGPENDDAPGSRGFSKVSDLHKFWVVQPSPVECGSAAEAMAISKITGRGPMSGSEIQRLSRENGTSTDGFNHGAGQRNMEMQLRHHGLNAETFNSFHGPHDQINQLDAELAKGHSAVAYIRNPDTRSHHGHFIFIDGKTADGKYVIGNSGSHTFGKYPAASRADLERWMQGEKHGAPYFTSVW